MKKNIEDRIRNDYHENVLKDLLPNCHVILFNGGFMYFELDGDNECLRGSDYYDDEISNLDLIHFTSIDNFRNILPTNVLRLYDLNFPDDPNEVVFPCKEVDLSFSSDEFEAIKSSLYNLSFCKYPFKSDEEEYNLWRLYGRDGNGVGLVFSINNDYKDWCDFHLSRIYYNDIDKLKKLKFTIDKHGRFIKQISRSDVPTKRNTLLPSQLTKFLAFHKLSIFKIENEYRLLFYNRASNPKIKIVKFLNKYYKASSYIELSLFDPMETVNSKQPSLVLKEIILGFRYNETQKEKLEEALKKAFTEGRIPQLQPMPQIRITELKKYFS